MPSVPSPAARLRALVLATVLTAVLSALTGLAQVAAPAASADLPGPSAAPGTAARPGPRVERLQVVDHNVELRQAAVQAALGRAVRTRASFVMLQEVCWWQAGRIREQHPGWTVAYQRGTDSPRCRQRGLGGLLARRDSGLVAIWTGGPGGAVTSRIFRHQGVRVGVRAAEGRMRDGVVCVSWSTGGVARRGCSTHLVNASRYPGRRRGTQFRQAREVRRLTSGWVRRGDVVVVGGDFNASPRSRPMDVLYRVGGDGAFHEATACPRTVAVCRRALSTTFDGGKIKIDYVFFSANRMVVTAPRRLTVVPTSSDHHLLSAWAYVDTSR